MIVFLSLTQISEILSTIKNKKIIKNEYKSQNNQESNSPIFGSSSSKTEDDEEKEISKHSNIEMNNPFNISNVIESHNSNNLRENLEKLKVHIQAKENDQKQQILHIETLGMMTKYQFVFIKLETSLEKLAFLFDSRKLAIKSDSFYSILNKISLQNQIKKYKNIFTLEKLNSILKNNLIFTLKQAKARIASFGFYALLEYSKIYSNEKKFKEELDILKEENKINLSKKDHDIKLLNKKNEELKSQIIYIKSKEKTLINELPDNNRLRKEIHSNKNFSGLEKKYKEIESENLELKEKLTQTENNLNVFIKEMSELLDSHELSSNLATDENYSGNNSNPLGNENEDDIDIIKNSKNNIQNISSNPMKIASTKENRIFTLNIKGLNKNPKKK